MNKKGIWIGLFTHIDSVTRGTLELLLKLKGMGFEEQGKEYFVDEEKFKTIDKIITRREWRVGGNAGNAALFLGDLGIECNLSAPVRPSKLMRFFRGLPVHFWGSRRKTAKSAERSDDPNFEHMVIELFPPLSNAGRTILSWDPMTRDGWIDEGFWNHMDKGLLLLSGFHLIKKRESIDNILDRLGKKDMKVYLEVGEPNDSMKYALDRMLQEDLVNHIGLNEREAQMLFGVDPRDLVEAPGKGDVGITVHTPDFLCSTEKKMLRSMIDAVQAWAMGGLGYYKQVHSLPLKRTPEGTTPTRNLPFVDSLVGLGDANSALDAVRVFRPDLMKKLVRSLPFYGSDKFSPEF